MKQRLKNMKTNKKDVLLLDDNNKYLIISRVKYNKNIYLYLIDINDNTNIKFCQVEESVKRLVELENKNLIRKLLPLFLKNSYKAT